jgi:hypothetical protein
MAVALFAGGVGWGQATPAAHASVCVDAAVPIALGIAAREQADTVGIAAARCPDKKGLPMVARRGFDPIRPELSVDAGTIVRDIDTNGGVATTVEVLLARDNAEWALAAPTGGIVASSFACAGDDCWPVGFEVYVRESDSTDAVKSRVRLALGNPD